MKSSGIRSVKLVSPVSNVPAESGGARGAGPTRMCSQQQVSLNPKPGTLKKNLNPKP